MTGRKEKRRERSKDEKRVKIKDIKGQLECTMYYMCVYIYPSMVSQIGEEDEDETRSREHIGVEEEEEKNVCP